MLFDNLFTLLIATIMVIAYLLPVKHNLLQAKSETKSAALPSHPPVCEQKQTDPNPRKIILGKYERLELLGEGSFGRTYHAIDLETGEECAIKVLKPPNTAQYNWIQREFRIAKMATGHRNVVKCKAYYEEGPFCYIVMDLVKGKTLYDAIEDGIFKNNDGRIKFIFLQLLDVVEDLHSKGIYHRDLKTLNVPLTEDWTVKLIDFGAVTTKLQGSSLRGTECYLPPEAFLSDTCDSVAADIWGLGQILLEMSTSNIGSWSKAGIEDEDYRDFLTSIQGGNKLYFRQRFSLLRSTSVILFMTLQPEPKDRISIPILRTNIKEADNILKKRLERN